MRSLVMKLSEILTEAPIGLGQQMWTGAKQKVASKTPFMKDTAANLQGQRDYQKNVNTMYTQLNKYLGSMGKNMKTATAGDIKQFLQKQNVQPPQALAQVQDNQPINKAQVGQWLKAAGQAQAQAGGQQQRRRVQPTRQKGQQQRQAAGGDSPANLEKRISQLEQMIKQMRAPSAQ